MSKSLLEALKGISSIMRFDTSGATAAEGICNELAAFIKGGVFILDCRGRVLANAAYGNVQELFRMRESIDGLYIDSRTSDRLRELAKHGQFMDFKPKNSDYCVVLTPLHTIIEYLAVLITYKPEQYMQADMELIEAAAMAAMLVLKYEHARDEAQYKRDIDSVKLALDSLSYSELGAAMHVFQQLGADGRLVASKLADSIGLTRSIVVSALRKLESAGVIETRSLGVKGTYIKVLNPVLYKELDKIRK